MTMKTLSTRSGALSDQAILFAILVACHASLRFTNIAVQLVPESAIVTIAAFLVVAAFWVVDLAAPETEKQQQRNRLYKWALVMLAIGLITILPTVLMIFWHVTAEAPHSFSHDGLVQSTAAAQFVLEGKNPYVEDYRNTPLADWPVPLGGLTENPALDHYVYLPLTFLLPLPFQALAAITWGWFDHRILYLILFVAVLLLGQTLMADPSRRLTWLIVIGLNPVFVPAFIEGRNDILVLFGLVLSIWLLWRGRVNWSAAVLGLACTAKQFAWFIVPFYFLYLGQDGPLAARFKRVRSPLIIFSAIFALVILPWFIWNPAAFWEDIFTYVSGSFEAGFPIAGFGFSKALVELGIVDSTLSPFPHGILQAVFGLPVFAALFIRQWKNNRLSTVLIFHAMWLFVLGFFSRIFFDNYLAFVIAVATFGSLIDPPLRERPAESPG